MNTVFNFFTLSHHWVNQFTPQIYLFFILRVIFKCFDIFWLVSSVNSQVGSQTSSYKNFVGAHLTFERFFSSVNFVCAILYKFFGDAKGLRFNQEYHCSSAFNEY